MTTSQLETLRDTLNTALEQVSGIIELKPAEPEWKLTNELPGFRPLRDGEGWHFPKKWNRGILPDGYRPLLVGEEEQAGDQAIFEGGNISVIRGDGDETKPELMQIPRRTKRPLPLLTAAQVAEGWKEWSGGNEIRIVNQDGRCLFEVLICKDQASIEVRAVDTHKVGDVIHDGLLIIQPKASNNIVVSTPAY